jgi:hypothetical protein
MVLVTAVLAISYIAGVIDKFTTEILLGTRGSRLQHGDLSGRNCLAFLDTRNAMYRLYNGNGRPETMVSMFCRRAGVVVADLGNPRPEPYFDPLQHLC